MRVLVLMSTYNGEKYLREQIDSILNQVGVEVYLLIRDDGSNDSTCMIIDEYVRKHKNIEVVKGDNVGFVKSFSQLVAIGIKNKVQADFFSFSDQDDVWMSCKLKRAYNVLVKENQDYPLLFSSNSIYVDEHMNEMDKFHEKEPFRTKENVMVYPTEQGCSMVFNRKAAEIFSNYPPINDIPHDRWIHMLCNFLGNTFYEHQPLFYYRIHGKNAIGKKVGILNRIINDIVFFFSSKSNHREYTKDFLMSFHSLLSIDSVSIIDIYLKYPKVLKYKLKMIFDINYCGSLDIWTRIRKTILILFNKL